MFGIRTISWSNGNLQKGKKSQGAYVIYNLFKIRSSIENEYNKNEEDIKINYKKWAS